MNKSRDIEVTIIFIGNLTFEWNNKYIGAPLYVWINDNDTWQYVVNCIFEKGKYIMSCYMESVNNKKNQFQKVNDMDINCVENEIFPKAIQQLECVLYFGDKDDENVDMNDDQIKDIHKFK